MRSFLVPLLVLGAAACAAPPAATDAPATPAGSRSDTPRVYELEEVTGRPELTNGPELRQLLAQSYPAALRDAGIGGSATVVLVVGVNGRPRDVEVARSSGSIELDAASVTVAKGMRFTPGRMGATVVPVRVRVPVTWQVPG